MIGPQVLKGSDSVQLDTPTPVDRQAGLRAAIRRRSRSRPGPGDHYVTLNTSHGAVQQRQPASRRLREPRPRRDRQGEAAESLTGVAGYALHLPGHRRLHRGRRLRRPARSRGTVHQRRPGGRQEVHEKAAGYPSGKYTGNATVLVVGSDNGHVEPAIIQIVNRTSRSWASTLNVSQVDQSVMYAKYCGVPKAGDRRLPDGRLDA